VTFPTDYNRITQLIAVKEHHERLAVVYATTNRDLTQNVTDLGKASDKKWSVQPTYKTSHTIYCVSSNI